MESIAPQATAIWMLLLFVIALTATAMILSRLRADGRPTSETGGSDNDDVRYVQNDARRYAGEVAVAAERAAVTAARHRAEWEESAADVDAAWAVYEAADLAARRTAAASIFPVSKKRRPGENVDRERYLHRAATAACRRREISIRQLNEALAHRGWNPRLHPVVQEAVLRQAVRDHRLAVYRSATARERQAWQTAERSADALRSLRAEAQVAQVRTRVLSADERWWAEQWDSTVPIRSTVDSRHPIAA